ncbi:NAD(P)/FAD-dependent oxidoreductase [Prauserella muralis]|uniref:Oxidoreductase n=1 Tax=Prauserella muralis TaxID=588067 RepID=A0A2V4B1D1_9PSEU|nr:FAD-dependent oxidoreductase [Prauserella muralis]PXY27188.1 oxidoreductase [Prauserella muralis]TWE23160.1 D-amino-acid dehydrogenase [Prauserella muralis]
MRIIVIGSGIAGAGTAYHLARAGAEVVVVDAALSGAATAAGAGIVSPWTSRRLDDTELAFAARAAAYYRTLVELLAEDGRTDSSFEVVGGMVVSADAAELAEVHERINARADAWPEAGVVSRLDPAQAGTLFAALAPELGAVHVSGAGRVDGRALRDCLLAAAEGRGARLLEGRAELRVSGDRVAGVRVGEGTEDTVDADAVVVAAGAWSAELLAPLGVRLAVEPQRGQISHFELPGVDTTSWPVVLPPSSHYLLAFPGSRVVAGATREDGSGFDYRVTAAGQQEVLREALAVAPGLADATLLETRIGFRPATPDGLPLLGALDGHPELVVCGGFGPAGLTLGPLAAHLAAAVALGQRPEVDLTPLRPERFTNR